MLLHKSKGQGLIEYAFILVLVAIIAIVGLQFFSGVISGIFGEITNQVNNL